MAVRSFFGGIIAGEGAAAAVAATIVAMSPGVASAEADRIVVTGSRLPSNADIGVAPVQIIGRDEIERSGAQSVAALLKTLSAGNANGADESGVLSFAPGVSALSMRGLGAHSTLVLIDGRRVTPAGFSPNAQTPAVNLSSLPLEMVERVEVLLDGASAVYGSDAVGGVVNLITRRSQQGSVVRVSAGAGPGGSASSGRASVTAGLGEDSGRGIRAVIGFEHQHQHELKASERSRTATGDFTALTGRDWRSTYAYPGNLYTAGGPDGAGTTFLRSLAPCTEGSDPGGACYYDPVRHQDLIPRISRDAVFGQFTSPLGNAQLFSTWMIGRTSILQENPSYSSQTYYQFFGATPGAAITLPVGHPQNPTGAPVALRTAWADRPTLVDTRSNDRRFVLGGRADLDGWSTEVAVLRSTSSSTSIRSGVIRDGVALQEVLDPAKDLVARPSFRFGDPSGNSGDLMARLYPTLRSRGDSALTGIDIKSSRDIAALPGGPLTFLLGAERRQERFASVPDPLLAAGEISLLGSYAAQGSRRVNAVFAELAAPLLRGLELRAALRNDHYQDVGGATTPKLAYRWQAFETLALRGNVSRGFRAPSIGELTQAPTVGFFAGIRDPKLCNDPTDTTNAQCSRFVQAALTRNSTLRPERSTSRGLGFVFTPSSDTSFSVDFYDLRRFDEIATFDPSYVLANESRLSELVTRDPVTGEIVTMTLPLTNIGQTRVRGFDLSARSAWKLEGGDRLTMIATANLQPTFRVTPVPGADAEQRAGSYLQPKTRATLSATWDHGAFSLRPSMNRVGGYSRSYGPSDAACGFEATPQASLCRIAAWTTFNVALAWRPTSNLELTLYVQNLQNKAPPVDERFDTLFYTLYSPSYHDPRGRYLTAAARVAF